ncbi:N-terminal phage integrase SAM-like domain-containing protein [Ruminiclostridium papyrosolvens]|uniref:N-terminal phage integrase SAM-like domain-containing protein n=1 Tax=Ruminiclostridium papyrosolvens TaxID=29362 RepID=UPI0005952BF2|nr:N-terminal phage integrase SAM-like domain-containing protein [Ruminiclostridium papyrosolvens]
MIGSIEKRGKNSCRLIVSGGIGQDGKYIKYQKTIKFNYDDEKKRQKEAEKELSLFIAEIEKNQYIEPSRLTLSDFAEKWIKDYGKTNLAPKTLYRYEEMLNSRILPALGHLKIEKLNLHTCLNSITTYLKME